MDRFEAMKLFLAVIDAGSLSAAARRRKLPLTTVSRKIAALEAHLKTPLLVRGGRTAIPTDTGRAYAEACRRILDDVGEAERLASGEYAAPKGHLTITAPIVFGRTHVLPVVTDFLRAYPDISIRLLLADRIVNLHEEQVDLALRIGDLPDSGLVAVKLGAIRRVLCASPAYLAARGVPKHPRELAMHDCIDFSGASASDAWTFAAANRALTIPVKPRLAVNTAEAAIDAVIADLGVTRLLSYQVHEGVKAGRMRLLLEDYEPPEMPVHLVHGGNDPIPQKIRAFIDSAAPRLRSTLAEIAR